MTYARLREILLGALGRGPGSLVPWALVGLFLVSQSGGFALMSSSLLIVVHLAYAHNVHWMPYYLETIPVFAALAALGLTRLATWVQNARWKLVVRVGTAGFFVVWLVGAISTLPRARSMRRLDQSAYIALRSRLMSIPDSKAVVFVRKTPWHSLGQSLVINEPDLDRASVWIVHDLGSENARLLASAPDRMPYLYDEQQRKLLPLRLADSLPRSQRNR
jgi:hypothetical protein